MLAVFLDIEATGLDPLKHKIIEIAFVVVDLTTKKRRASYRAVVRQSQDDWNRRDPGSTEFNGFTFPEVDRGQDAGKVLDDIQQLFADYQIVRGHALFICQNPAFDRSFFTQIANIPLQESLQWPYHWLDLASMYFALTFKGQTSLPENFSVSKNQIAEKFNIPPEPHPHRALGGVNHLIACYEALLGVAFE